MVSLNDHYVHKAIRNYLWMGDINIVAAIAISWKFCASPLKVGGLGIKNLILFHDALFSKLAWNVLIDLFFVHGFLWNRFQGKINHLSI